MSTIPGRQTVALECGGRVFIRVARSRRALEFAKLVQGAKTESGRVDDEEAIERTSRVVRWGVVGAEGATDENGQAVEFETDHDDELGEIASAGFVDRALTLADLNRIAERILAANAVTAAQGKR